MACLAASVVLLAVLLFDVALGRRRPAELRLHHRLPVVGGRECGRAGGTARHGVADGRGDPLHRAGGRRDGDLPRGVRRQRALVQPADRGEHPEPRRGSLDRLRHPRSGVPRARPLRPGQRGARGRPDAGPAGAAGGDHRRPRGHPRGAAVDPRGLDGARRHPVADDLAPGAAGRHSQASRPA